MNKSEQLIACLEGEIAKRDARIAELEARIVWLECESQVSAAPVSEAKAQVVVMPEPDIKTGHGYPAYSVAAVTELFARLKAAPVQQVSVPDGWKLVPVEPTEAMRKAAQDKLASEGLIVTEWLIHTAYSAMLANAPAAPAAPAADAYPHGHPLHREVFMALESWTGSDTLEDGVRALIAALAAHRAKGVV